MSQPSKSVNITISLFILLLIAGIFVSLFTGEYDFSKVQEGRTAIHIGFYLLVWGILIPLSFKYSNYSFVLKWIYLLEKALQFGYTKMWYILFNTILAISFGIISIAIGIGVF